MDVKKERLKYLKQLAQQRGGLCLSNEYINGKTKLKWQCSKGHVWKAIPSNVIHSKRWFPVCGGSQKKTIEDMHELAEQHSGKCLSKKYANWKTKLEWQCNKGHKFEMIPNNVKKGQWCPYCVGKYQTIENMFDLAKQHSGKCLSTEYKNNKTKLKWQCSKGHKFEMDQNHVHNGCWCPQCSNSLCEKITRQCFEKILGVSFNFAYPKWLKNSRGNRMELDGYNKEMGVAFEYQGIQHYKEVACFNKTTTLYQIQKDDKRKKKLCKQNNVLLIEILYWIKRKDIKKFVYDELCKSGVVKKQLSLPFNFESDALNMI